MRVDGGPDLYEVVGVIASRPYDTPAAPGRRVYLLPLAQGAIPAMPTLAVRAPASRAREVVTGVRRALEALDPELPVFNVRTATLQRDRALAQERLAASLLTCFGAVALLLASMALYGVLASEVVRRLPELAIRMALGARRAIVMRMVVGDALRLVATGVGLGLPIAVSLTAIGLPVVAGLSAYDPAVYVAAVAVTMAVGALAAWLPARRAAETDAVSVMRAS